MLALDKIRAPELIEFLHDVTESVDIETLWNLHTQKMLSFGFDRLLYGFTRFRSGQSVGDPTDLFVLSNHNREYIKAFFKDERFTRGPMARWALENEGACSWSLITDMAHAGVLSADELSVLQFNQSMGVQAGYTISFQSFSDRFRGAIALVASPKQTQAEIDEMWLEHGDDIHLMNKVVHLKFQTLPRENSSPLTKRQNEVLDWIGDGKSVADVAIVLNLTAATVEKHLRLAREALNAETTAQAILKRAFQNQVFTSDKY